MVYMRWVLACAVYAAGLLRSSIGTQDLSRLSVTEPAFYRKLFCILVCSALRELRARMTEHCTAPARPLPATSVLPYCPRHAIPRCSTLWLLTA